MAQFKYFLHLQFIVFTGIVLLPVPAYPAINRYLYRRQLQLRFCSKMSGQRPFSAFQSS